MEELQTSLCAIDGETLMDMPLALPRFCVGGLLPQGLSILGGAPKIGKSWLVLDLCVRIAKGEPVWNLDTIPGTTLYLCLEDPLHRVQQRLASVTDEAPANAYFATVAGSLADDLEGQILSFLREHPDTVLIVVDTFQMVRGNNGEPTYGSDYQEMQKLKRIADSQRISILLVHHLRKQGVPLNFEFLSVSYLMSSFVFFFVYWMLQDYIHVTDVARAPEPQQAAVVEITSMSAEQKLEIILGQLKDGEVLAMREREILELMLKNKKRKEIAAELFLSENTVKTYTRTLYAKLGVSSRDELYALLLRK